MYYEYAGLVRRFENLKVSHLNKLGLRDAFACARSNLVSGSTNVMKRNIYV